MSIDKQLLTQIIEGALLASGQPMTVEKMLSLFDEENDVYPQPAKDEIKQTLEEIQANCQGRGFELVEVGSGWRFQVRKETAPWVNRLWDEKPQRYSRALLETIALIAYRQPITRGDIEEIRGVAVSSHIIKTLSEREWIKVVGHRDVPGRPSLYATTRGFLDYFNLKSLEELPSLGEIKDLEELNKELDLGGDIPDSVKQTLELPPEEPESVEGETATEVNQDTDTSDAGEDDSIKAQPVVLEGTGEGDDFEPNAEAFETGWIDDGEEDDSSAQDGEQPSSEQEASTEDAPTLGESAFEESGLDNEALSEAAIAIAVDDEDEEEPGPLDRLMSGQAPEGYEDNDNNDDEIISASKDGNAENESEDDAEDTPSESESGSLFAPSTAPSVFD
mgnify:CR=1 FL=1